MIKPAAKKLVRLIKIGTKICALLFLFLLAASLPAKANKLGINFGRTSAEQAAFSLVGGTTNAGWVVILAGPNNCQDLISLINEHNFRVIIRAWNGGCAFTRDHYLGWVATLADMAGKISADKQIYFIPWNEPQHPEECVSADGANSGDPTSVMDATEFLAKKLVDVGLRGNGKNKVVLLSPAMDPLYPTQAISGDKYLSLFDGIAVNAYTGGSFSTAQGFVSFVKNRLILPGDKGYNFYLTEVGSTIDTYTPIDTAVIGQKPVFDNASIAEFLKSLVTTTFPASGDEIKVAAVLDHDPHCVNNDGGTVCGIIDSSGLDYYGWNLYKSAATRAVYASYRTANIPPVISFSDVSLDLDQEGLYPCNSCAYYTKNDHFCGPGSCPLQEKNSLCQIIGVPWVLGCSKVYAKQELTNPIIDDTEEEGEPKTDHPLLEVDDGKGGTIFAIFSQSSNSRGTLQEDLEACIMAHTSKPCGSAGRYACSEAACKDDDFDYDGLGCPNAVVADMSSIPGYSGACRGPWKICGPTCRSSTVDPRSIPGCCKDDKNCNINVGGITQEEINAMMDGWMTRITNNYQDGVAGWKAVFAKSLEAIIDSAKMFASLLAGTVDIGDLYAELYANWNSVPIREGEEETGALTGQSGFQIGTVAISPGSLTTCGIFGCCANCSKEELLRSVTEANYTTANAANRKQWQPGTIFHITPPGHGLLNQTQKTAQAGALAMSLYSDRGTESVNDLEAGIIGMPAITQGVEATTRLFRVPEGSRRAYQPPAKKSTALAVNFLTNQPNNNPLINLAQAGDNNVRFPKDCVNGESNPCAFFSVQERSPKIYFKLQTSSNNIYGFQVTVYDISNFTRATMFIPASQTQAVRQDTDGSIIYHYGCGLEPGASYYMDRFNNSCPADFYNLANDLCETGNIDSVAIDVFDTSRGGPIASFYGNPENNPGSTFASCWEKSFFGGGLDDTSGCRDGFKPYNYLEMCRNEFTKTYNQAKNPVGNEDTTAGLEAAHAESGSFGTIFELLENDIENNLPNTKAVKDRDGCQCSCFDADGNPGDDCNCSGNNDPACVDCHINSARRPQPTYKSGSDFVWSCAWTNFTRENTATLNPRLPEFFKPLVELVGGIYEDGQPVRTDTLFDKIFAPPSKSITVKPGDQKIAWGYSGEKGAFDSSSEQYADDEAVSPSDGAATDVAHFDPLGVLFSKSHLMTLSLNTPDQAAYLEGLWDKENPSDPTTSLAYTLPEYSALAQRQNSYQQLAALYNNHGQKRLIPLLGSLVETLRRW